MPSTLYRRINRRKSLRVFEQMFYCLSRITAIVTLLITSALINNRGSFEWSSQSSRLPENFPTSNTSRYIFYASCIIYTMVATTWYHIHQWDALQDRFLLGSMLSGLAFGIYLKQDLEAILFGILPFAISTGLLLNRACAILSQIRIENTTNLHNVIDDNTTSSEKQRQIMEAV
ncbi:uncharacterized protein K452DRAFT_111551 [Aplosporella prunicola CBS 121167]|uniref:Uncharacterized protein n=1 Tax=Aplosporella prunicola CBS 121167 TaxID=1176127 RepID=A0A6A6AZE5_9PEZI|nr:uncharacterized protein K452DRAFT_111551 [Aplosporella prunicola CBS 121167]KAF2137312.1 hypothetical protein K452DRAFT_111551 [Aplosporella prunicola CBS 121167]